MGLVLHAPVGMNRLCRPYVPIWAAICRYPTWGAGGHSIRQLTRAMAAFIIRGPFVTDSLTRLERPGPIRRYSAETKSFCVLPLFIRKVIV